MKKLTEDELLARRVRCQLLEHRFITEGQLYPRTSFGSEASRLICVYCGSYKIITPVGTFSDPIIYDGPEGRCVDDPSFIEDVYFTTFHKRDPSALINKLNTEHEKECALKAATEQQRLIRKYDYDF